MSSMWTCFGRDLDQAADDRDHVLAHECTSLSRFGWIPGRTGGRCVVLASSSFPEELVAADAGEIVALLVEEQRLDQLLGVLRVLGLAGTQLLVDLFLSASSRVLTSLSFSRAVDDQRAVPRRTALKIASSALPVEPEVGDARARARRSWT